VLRAEVMEVFLCITNPHPEPGVWALRKQFREAIKSLIISSHTEISHSSKTTHHKCQTQKNVNNHLANYVKNS